MPSPSESASPSNNNPISEIVSSIYFVQFLLKSSKCWLSENTITVDMLSLWDTHCSQFWQISEKKMKTVLLISHPRKLRRVQTRTEREDKGRKNSAFWRKNIFFIKVTFYFLQLLVSHLKVRKHCPPVHGIQNSRVRVDQLCRLPGHFLAKIRHDMWDNYFRGDSFLDFFTK